MKKKKPTQKETITVVSSEKLEGRVPFPAPSTTSHAEHRLAQAKRTYPLHSEAYQRELEIYLKSKGEV